MQKETIMRYVKMGGCQYLRDYRMAQRLKKTAELRKQVMEQNKKLTQKNDQIPFQEIQKDPSPGRTVSNGRQVGFVTRHKCNGLSVVYSKTQLIQLCEPYGVTHISRFNKTSLSQRLASAIATNKGMLVPAAVDSRQYAAASTEMDAASGRVCLRLSSVSVRQPSQSGTLFIFTLIHCTALSIHTDSNLACLLIHFQTTVLSCPLLNKTIFKIISKFTCV